MAKEKKEITPKAPKDFFYEITAVLIILISLIILSELGMVGVFLKKGFKFIFGDFYFIIIIALIINSIFALVKQKWIYSRSLKFNGFLLFIANLLLLIHLNFLSLYGIKSDRILASTFELFRQSILSEKALESFGGGIIGAILSQIFMVLFGYTGSLILAIIFIIMSISFMTNLNFKKISCFIKFLFIKIKTFFLAIIRYFKQIEYPKKGFKASKIFSLDLLNDLQNNPNEFMRREMSKSEHDAIINMVYQGGGFIVNEAYYLGYSYTRYILYGTNINLNENRLDTMLGQKTIFYVEKDRVIIEVAHKIKKLLSLKNLLMLHNEELIPFGVEINGNVIGFKMLEIENILLSGMKESGVKTFIKAFILTLIFRLKGEFSLFLIDFKHDFSDLKYLPNMQFSPIYKEDRFSMALDNISEEIEKRMNILSTNQVNDYMSLNNLLVKKKVKPLKPLFIIINDIGEFKNIDNPLRLLYFLKFSFRCGVFFILISRNPGTDERLINAIKTKIILRTNSLEQSYEILKNKNACLLANPGDAFMVYNMDIYHLQLPFITNKDYNNVIAKFIMG